MNRKTVAAVVLATTTLVQCLHADGCGFGPYVLTPEPMTWQDAEAYAVSLGGHLVSIGSADENATVTALVLSGRPDAGWWWIGLTDAESEGTWRWVSGEPLTYTAWHSGEPNDVDQPCNNTGEDYARGAPSGWWDWSSPLTSCRLSLAIGVVELPGPATTPDLNTDGHVNGQDLALVLGFWGQCGASCFGDANCDGIVDGEDLAIVLGAWTG